MKSTTFALTTSASLASASADERQVEDLITKTKTKTNTVTNTNTNTLTNTELTNLTGYNTYCIESTVITITTCEDQKCAPHVYTVPESSTFTVTGKCVFSTAEIKHTKTSEAISEKIVTGYTTYCPEPTVVTISTCTKDKCAPYEYTFTEAKTSMVSEECIVPTDVAAHTDSHLTKQTKAVSTTQSGSKASSAAHESTIAVVSSYEAGFAGFVSVIALLI